MLRYLTNTKLKILLMYLVAYASLWLSYARFIVPIYGYAGFEWAPNKIKVFESLLVIAFFALSMPLKIKRPSDIFIHVHFLLPVVPMLVLYSGADLPRAYMYFVILAFAVVCVVRKFKLPYIIGDFIPLKVMMWGLLTFAAFLIFSIVLYGGFKYFNLDFMKIYDFRTDIYKNLPRIFQYLIPIAEKVMLPSALLIAVNQRKRFIAGLALFGSFMLFGLTSNKGTIFYPFFVLFIYWISSHPRRLIKLLLAAYIIIIIVSLFPLLINNSESIKPSLSPINIDSLLVRRGYFIPALLNFYYYAFFSENLHVMWAQSVFTFGMLDYPYDIDSSYLISQYFLSKEMTRANCGWFGSGYMHFGFAGMLIYALLFGLIFAAIDTLAKKKENRILAAMLFIPILAIFLSSDMLTGLLTHGLILAIILVWACQIKGRGSPVLPNNFFKANKIETS